MPRGFPHAGKAWHDSMGLTSTLRQANQSVLAQQLDHFLLQVLATKVFGDDAVVLVEDNRVGDGLDTEEDGNLRHLQQLASLRPGQIVGGDGLLPGGLVGVERHAEDFKAFCVVFLVHFHHTGILVAAGLAPRCPKINHFHLPLDVGEGYGCPSGLSTEKSGQIAPTATFSMWAICWLTIVA